MDERKPLGVAVAGCGGGSSFASQASSICKTYNAKINALGQPSNPSEIPAFLDKVVPLFQQGTAKLAALKPPSDKTSQAQQWISTLQQEVTVTQQAQTLAHGGNTNQAVTLLQREQQLNDTGKAQAKALGATECAK